MGRKRPARPITRTSDVLDIQDYLRYKNYRDYVLFLVGVTTCLLYTSPSPRDPLESRMPSSA